MSGFGFLEGYNGDMLKITRPAWLKILVLSLLFPGLLIFASMLLGPHFPDWYCGTLCLSFPVCLILAIVAGVKLSQTA